MRSTGRFEWSPTWLRKDVSLRPRNSGGHVSTSRWKAVITASSAGWAAISRRLLKHRPLSYLDLPQLTDLRDGSQVTEHWDRVWRARLARNEKARRVAQKLAQ